MTLFLLLVAWTGVDPGAATESRSQTPQPAETRVTVRVHHLHFRVGDPSAAMQAYADRLSGSRVIVQGLGVGVRVGTHYLLFDRDREGAAERATAPGAIESAYRSAVPWLASRGVLVAAGDFGTLPRAALTDPIPFDHIAFVTADYPGTIDLIMSRGGTPISRTSDAAMFGLPDGTRVEIVRDVDAPDAFWCPMHPDVRSGTTGKCPLCAMDLVRIPPPRLGEYRMDVTASAGPGGRGLGGLRIAIREPGGRGTVSDFSIVHERPLHVFVVGRTLEYFAHVHPDRGRDGTFSVAQAAPPGEYVVIADFVPKTGTAQMIHRAIVTPGYAKLFTPVPALTPDVSGVPLEGAPARANERWTSAEKAIDGVRVRMEAADLMAGKRAIFRFRLFDQATGAPITTLEPFLGAPGHMLLVNAALTESIHGHPEEQETQTPFVTFIPLMPASGIYKLWVQFQRNGRVITAPFVIGVAER